MADLGEKLYLVGIGAQKAGSTWLARYLGGHPDVYVSRLKALHYFDRVYMSRLSGHVDGRLLGLAQGIVQEGLGGSSLNRKQMEKLSAIIDRLRITCGPRYPYMRFFQDRVTTEKVFCDITPGYSILDADGFEAISRVHAPERTRFLFILRDPVERTWSVIAHPPLPVVPHAGRMIATPARAARNASRAVLPCRRPVAMTLAAAA